MTGTPFHQCWVRIKQRCYNPLSKDYCYYGARGITVCDEWLANFEEFYHDMWSSYSVGLELDRINVNGNYHKENCRWVDEHIQSWNRRISYTNKTGCSGVSVTRGGKYEVRIGYQNEEKYLGTFDDLEDAVKCRKAAEKKLYGEELAVKRRC